MEITEVRIKLAFDDGPLQAFCAIQFDGEFVVRDLKVIQKIQEAVLNALEQERIRAQEPGYVCTYEDFDERAA